MQLGFSQQMKMSQQMKLAPRMIQSMEILQLPVMALNERIEQELQDLHRLDHARSQLHRLAHFHLLREVQMHDLLSWLVLGIVGC